MDKHPSHSTAALPADEPVSSAERARAASRSTWVSVGVNLCLSCAQILVGLVAHSQALVADGLHSLSDLFADFVVLVANRFSSAASDEDHHYGHYRYENAASLVIGLLLLAVATGMLWSGVHKVLAPEAITPAHASALWVAGAALIAKELLFRYMLAVAQRVRSTLLVANAWHARSDAASSLIALVGIGASLLGHPVLDPVAGLVVGLFVLRMGFSFTWAALSDLMDHSADAADNARIEDLIRTTPQVAGLHNLRTRKMGDLILVDVHVEVAGTLNVREGHDIALRARDRVLDAMPQVLNVMTHIDQV